MDVEENGKEIMVVIKVEKDDIKNMVDVDERLQKY